MSDIKWIPLGGMDLSAANLAAAEKLRKFGFSVICGEFGSEKLTKAGLCIYDVLQEKDNPNILLVTSDRELYGWYRILMTGIGADFKVITGAPNALVFFSKDCPNLYLMSGAALMGQNALRSKAGEDFVWDLVIIDAEQETEVPNYAEYEKNIPWRSEKLLVISPFPAKTEDDKKALVSLIKSVLDDKALAADADDIAFDAGACRLDADSPVMRYYGKSVYTGELNRNIEFVDYSFDESVINGLRRRVELRSGLPVYRFGGNVFEDYDVEQHKKLYEKNNYTRSDVEDLRAFDKKLDSFLKLMDKVYEEANGRAMVYCCDSHTLEYLRKVLTCVYKGSGIVRVAKSELFRSEDVMRKLRVDDSTEYPRVILCLDDIAAVGEGLDRITYIINYELPSSAAVLERRFTRHGAAKEAQRKFVIFRDANKLFDSRMLDKVLYGSIASGFCGALPSRNVLLDMDTKADSVNSLVADLKYIAGYASEVDNCLDLIKKVKCDYVLLGAEKLANGKQVAEYAGKLLDRVCGVFGFTKESSAEEIAAAVNGLSGLCVMDGGKLAKVPDAELAAMAQSFEGDGYLKQSFAAEAVSGLAEAKKNIDEWHSGENFHLRVKQELNALADCIQYPVLFGIWRFRVREQDSKRSFRDYIKIYNDGI